IEYQGDASLERMLAEARSPYDLQGLRALLAGVEAAPEASDPTAWIDLVAPEPSPALRSQLAAFRAAALPPSESASGAARVPSKAVLGSRLAALRNELARRGLAGFVVPRADEHQGEYVPPRAERLAWITGFTGSAGVAIVLASKAALFVD